MWREGRDEKAEYSVCKEGKKRNRVSGDRKGREGWDWIPWRVNTVAGEWEMGREGGGKKRWERRAELPLRVEMEEKGKGTLRLQCSTTHYKTN